MRRAIRQEGELSFIPDGGHDHDGINSALVKVAPGSIGMEQLNDALARIIESTREVIPPTEGGKFPVLPAPRNLQVTSSIAVNGASARLSATWDPPDTDQPIREYEFEYQDLSDDGISMNVFTTNTNVQVEGVTPNVRMRCRVRAINIFGRGETTDWVEITTARDEVPPAKVTGVEAFPGMKSIQVTWDENQEADTIGFVGGYEVMIDTSAEFNVAPRTFPAKGRGRGISDLETLRTYYIKVRAIDLSNNFGEYSDVVSCTPGFIGNWDEGGDILLPFEQTFSDFNADHWVNIIGDNSAATIATGGLHGDKVLRVTGPYARAWDRTIPYDPNKLYKMSGRFRQITDAGDEGEQKIYLGIEGIAADEETLVNTTGADLHGSQHYIAAADQLIEVADEWVTFTGYFKGHSAYVANSDNANTPSGLHTSVRYFRPVFYVNMSDPESVTEIDNISIEEVGFRLGQHEIFEDSITDGHIQTYAIRERHLSAGAITANALNIIIGAENIVKNSSFESGDLHNWFEVGSPTIRTVLSSGGWHMTDTLRVVSNFAGQGVSQELEISNVEPYYASAYVKVTSGSIKLEVEAGDTTVSVSSDTEWAGDNQWHRISVPFNGSEDTNVIRILSVGIADAMIDAVKVELSEVLTSYSIRTDEILPGTIVTNMISTEGLSAEVIKTGILDAELVNIININAGNITVGQMHGDRITAGSVSTSRLAVLYGSGNLLPNTSFERGTNPYLSPSGTLSNPSTDAHTGDECLGLVATGPASVYSPQIPVNPGDTYVFSAYVKQPASRDINLEAIFLDADNFTVSSAFVTHSVASGDWVRIDYVFTVPGTALTVKVGIGIATAMSGIELLIDSVQLERGNIATDYYPNPIELPPGSIVANHILAGAITGDHIAANSITAEDAVFSTAAIKDADIETMTVEKLTAGVLRVGSYIASSNYVAGEEGSGFKIDYNGTMELNNAIVRGSIYATNGSFTGEISGATIVGGLIQGAVFQTNGSGERLVIDQSETSRIKFYDTFSSYSGRIGLIGTDMYIQAFTGGPGISFNDIYLDCLTVKIHGAGGLEASGPIRGESVYGQLKVSGDYIYPHASLGIRFHNTYYDVGGAPPNAIFFDYWGADAILWGYQYVSSQSSGGFVHFSDRSLKKDIVPLETNALAAIGAAKPYRYSMESLRPGGVMADEEQIGLIADELPQDVKVQLGNGKEGVSLYPAMTLLWKGIQELDAKVEALEARLPARR